MTEHYFTANPKVASHESEFIVNIRGMKLRLATDRGVFSRARLDRATEVLLKTLALPVDARVLDLGCGYGPLGIVAARLAPAGRVVMVDVNARAVALARRNVVLNSLTNVDVFEGDGIQPVRGMSFTDALTNPPFRTGKSTVYRLLGEVHTVLEPGGRLWVVARNKQGAPSLKTYLQQFFTSVADVARSGGIHVFQAVKAIKG